jgi:hypothetical protein
MKLTDKNFVEFENLVPVGTVTVYILLSKMLYLFNNLLVINQVVFISLMIFEVT